LNPLPIDFDSLARALGERDLEIIQLRHQMRLMNEKLAEICDAPQPPGNTQESV
jgi:hypothetical protein